MSHKSAHSCLLLVLSGLIANEHVSAQSLQSVQLAGRVVDPNGNPVVGAKLFVVGGGVGPKAAVRAVADALGNFAFEMRRDEFGLNDSGIPWKFATVVAIAEGFGLDFRAAYCFDPTGTLARSMAVSQFMPGDQWDRTLRLVKDDVPIVGRIVDAHGKAVAGATIRVGSVYIPKAPDLTPWLEAVKAGEDYDIVVLRMNGPRDSSG